MSSSRSQKERVWRVSHEYTASDGEICLLSVDVTGIGITRSEAKKKAAAYLQEYGYRVVEDAKASGNWPLPPDHPNSYVEPS